MSADDFCINKLVPGYFSRINEDGSYSNGSGCGNDTASERNMVRKYIVDSVCYWADVFEYYKGLIKFRKAHPALRLSTSEDVKKYVKSVEGLGDNIVGINIKGGQKAGVETIETIKGGEYTMDGISALVLVKQDGAAMTIVIVLIAAVVVVAAGVVIVVMKKKKVNKTEDTVKKYLKEF